MVITGGHRLRSMFSREDEKIVGLKPSRLAAVLAGKYGYSPVLVEKYIQILGSEEARDLLEWNETPLPETIRCNDYLVPCSRLEEIMAQKGFQLSTIPWLPHGMEVLEQPIRVGATHEYLQGLYYIQDPGSMTVAYLLEPMPGEVIIDMAAAPGGKATQIQQLTGDSSLLIAVERSRMRMRALRSHMQRMGFKNYVALRMDSRLLPRVLGRSIADRVLLDAPSTGEGIIRKDPGRRVSRSQADIMKIHYLQVEMLDAALDLLKPGGRVVYAACSTSPEEGELVISRLLRLRSDFDIEPIRPPVGSEGIYSYLGIYMDERVSRCTRLWPHVHGTEGFFICVLRKKG